MAERDVNLPRQPRSFVSRVTQNRIFLVRGKDSTGRAAWWYVRVRPDKKSLFERNAKNAQVELTDYGEILMSGYAERPPPDVVRRMKEEYGFEE